MLRATKPFTLLLVPIGLLLTACALSPVATLTATLVPTATATLTATLTATPTATATPTTTPTTTPTATPTPRPVTPMLPAGTERVIGGAPMVFVPAGEFLMGSSDADSDADYTEKPQHKVYLDAFWIDKFEVTNALYKRCVDAGGCSAPQAIRPYIRYPYYGNSQYDNYPVLTDLWNDAAVFCEWAKKQLPTEAQWEKAARGTDGRIYPWGNSFNKHMLNSSEGGRGDIAAVGSYPLGASPCGAMDMAGNVMEWVADWYNSNYYRNSPSRNPTGPSSGSYRVLRGGMWWGIAACVRTAARGTETAKWCSIGFRCVQ